MKPAAVVAALALALTACVDTEGGSSPSPSPTTDRAPAATLHGRHIPLFPGTARALRIGFEPFAGAARIIVNARPSGARVHVCPLLSIGAGIKRSDCKRDVGNGVREPITRAGLRAIAVMADASGGIEVDVVLDYDEAGRSFEIRMPIMPAPRGGVDCSDNACNPFFEVVPTRSGTFTARASWTGSPASLILLQGSVLGRAETATGIPYAQAAKDRGASPLQLRARMSAPAEYALAFKHDSPPGSARTFENVAIIASWPEREPR